VRVEEGLACVEEGLARVEEGLARVEEGLARVETASTAAAGWNINAGTRSLGLVYFTQ